MTCNMEITYFGNRDARSRRLANLTDLAASAADDAADHICGNADVLGLDFLAIFVVGWRASAYHLRVGPAVKAAGGRAVAEISAVPGSHDTRRGSVFASSRRVASEAPAPDGTGARLLGAYSWVVENGAGAALPVIYETLADLPDRSLDALRRSLNLYDPLGRLRKHLLLRDHANTRDVLDVLDLETLPADDGAHLVMGDEELDGCASHKSATPASDLG